MDARLLPSGNIKYRTRAIRRCIGKQPKHRPCDLLGLAAPLQRNIILDPVNAGGLPAVGMNIRMHASRPYDVDDRTSVPAAASRHALDRLARAEHGTDCIDGKDPLQPRPVEINDL